VTVPRADDGYAHIGEEVVHLGPAEAVKAAAGMSRLDVSAGEG
jgi:hypothetical protein